MTDIARIICDHGEQRSGLPDLLSAQGCAVELARLPAGDFQLSAALAVERKAAADFVESLRNGRLLEQLQRLGETFERAALLVEGDSWEGNRDLKSPMLARLYQWTSLQPGLNVFYSPSTVYSARLLAGLARAEQFERHSLPPSLPAHVPKTRTPGDVLRALPGVGDANARKLLARFGTLRAVLLADEAELQETIGQKRGQRLHRLLAQA